MDGLIIATLTAVRDLCEKKWYTFLPTLLLYGYTANFTVLEKGRGCLYERLFIRINTIF